MQIKKITIALLTLVLILPCLIFSGANVIDFEATRDSNVVNLTWSTENESNIDYFTLRRSTDMITWYQISEKIKAHNAPSSYTYTDRTIFKGVESTTLYYYLDFVDQNGNKITNIASATCSGVSGFRHTWGSIKALFR